jgi:predicted lipid-binding transport protein (Tim44 family)
MGILDRLSIKGEIIMHGIRWSNLTVAGRIVLLTLLTLVIAIGLLAQEASRTPKPMNSGWGDLGHAPIVASTRDAMFIGESNTLKQDPPRTPKPGTVAGSATGEARYTPTEIQSLRLQVKQKDALLAKQQLEALQAAFQQVQQRYQDNLKALTDEGEKVKVENAWPKDTQFNPNDLTYAAAPVPVKKEDKK